jgi:uncharacterized Tic20 family protein
MRSPVRMGPGYFPTWVGGVLIVFGIAMLVQGVVKPEPVQGNWSLRALAILPLATVVFCVLMEHAGLIPSLVVLLVKGNESPTLRAHAVSALNFQITWNAAFIIGQILAVCSGGLLFFLPLACWVVIIVFSILGGLRANEGTVYNYPLSLKLVN